MLTHMKRFVLLVIAVVVDSHCLYLHPCPCVMDDSLDVITCLDMDMRLHPRTCWIAHHCPVHRVPWSVSLGYSSLEFRLNVLMCVTIYAVFRANQAMKPYNVSYNVM
jgi:hypothetical protein